MLDNLVAHPSDYNSNQSQQSLQWTHLNKHQSHINQSQARQAIPECSCPIMGLEARHAILECTSTDKAILTCTTNMHCIKEATKAQSS